MYRSKQNELTSIPDIKPRVTNYAQYSGPSPWICDILHKQHNINIRQVFKKVKEYEIIVVKNILSKWVQRNQTESQTFTIIQTSSIIWWVDIMISWNSGMLGKVIFLSKLYPTIIVCYLKVSIITRTISLFLVLMTMVLLVFSECPVFPAVLQVRDLILSLKSMMNMKILFIKSVGVILLGFLALSPITQQILLLVLFQVCKSIGFFYEIDNLKLYLWLTLLILNINIFG